MHNDNLMDIDWKKIFQDFDFSTFEKLKRYLSEVLEDLKNKNDYTIFFSLIDYITILVENGEDINATDTENGGNETFLSYFFYSFFDYGIELSNCKVYNPYSIMIFKHCITMGANPFIKSYSSRYSHNELNKESLLCEICHTIKWNFWNRLNHQNNDEDSFLVYKEIDLLPFKYIVPDDPYPEYSMKDFDDFFLMKFRYLLRMLDIVLDKMHYSMCEEYDDLIYDYVQFIETDFVEIFPHERLNALAPYYHWRNIKLHNFWIFIILSGFCYSTNDENVNAKILQRRLLNQNYAMIQVFDSLDIVKYISCFL